MDISKLDSKTTTLERNNLNVLLNLIARSAILNLKFTY